MVVRDSNAKDEAEQAVCGVDYSGGVGLVCIVVDAVEMWLDGGAYGDEVLRGWGRERNLKEARREE